MLLVKKFLLFNIMKSLNLQVSAILEFLVFEIAALLYTCKPNENCKIAING